MRYIHVQYYESSGRSFRHGTDGYRGLSLCPSERLPRQNKTRDGIGEKKLNCHVVTHHWTPEIKAEFKSRPQLPPKAKRPNLGTAYDRTRFLNMDKEKS